MLVVLVVVQVSAELLDGVDAQRRRVNRLAAEVVSRDGAAGLATLVELIFHIRALDNEIPGLVWAAEGFRDRAAALGRGGTGQRQCRRHKAEDKTRR